MGKFLLKLAVFTLVVAVCLVVGLFLPVTPKASRSFYYSEIYKDSLLRNVDSPRLIFIGGSNISFGLNCQMIKDSLNVNPINTGISASMGLKFMFENTAQYIRPGDVIIAPLEYSHFTRDYYHCAEALLRLVMDVDVRYARLLNFRQMFTLLPFVPAYVISKFNPTAYFRFKVDPYYDRMSFNIYGDECLHWEMENQQFTPLDRLDAFNRQIIDRIRDFRNMVEQKGARFYITYPSYMTESFNKSKDIIADIQDELEMNFDVLGTPERYMMPDSLMFDTSYHLNKTGMEIRTVRLIEDIKNARISF